jgi:uncharacterized metal-binding protein
VAVRSTISRAGRVRFFHAISMAVDQADGLFIGNADVVWLYADNRTIVLMKFAYGIGTFSFSRDVHKPQVGKLGWKWR